MASWTSASLCSSFKGNERRYKFGIGIKRCRGDGCRSIFKTCLNRGCLECDQTFCSKCYARHKVGHIQDVPNLADIDFEYLQEENLQHRQQKVIPSRVAPGGVSQIGATSNELTVTIIIKAAWKMAIGIAIFILALSVVFFSVGSVSSQSDSVWPQWQWSPNASAQGHDVFVEVPSIHDALKNNKLNIWATSVSILETMHEDVRIVGILGFSHAFMSTLATRVKNFRGDRKWIVAQALLPGSSGDVDVERHFRFEDASNTGKFVLDLLVTISDILVFIVDDYNWLEQLFMFRYYETRRVIQSSDSCRDPLILQLGLGYGFAEWDDFTISAYFPILFHAFNTVFRLGGTSGERYNALKMRLETCAVARMQKGRRLQDVLLDAASSSLTNIIESFPTHNEEAKSAINMSYHSSGIQLFDAGFSWSPVEAHAEQHNMNVYDVDVNDSEGVPCKDRFIEIEFPGAQRSEFEILRSDGHYYLRRIVSNLHNDIDLPFEEDWSVDLNDRLTLEDGILTLTQRRCFNP